MVNADFPPAMVSCLRREYFRCVRERIFSRIYRENLWGSPESRNGSESTLVFLRYGMDARSRWAFTTSGNKETPYWAGLCGYFGKTSRRHYDRALRLRMPPRTTRPVPSNAMEPGSGVIWLFWSSSSLSVWLPYSSQSFITKWVHCPSLSPPVKWRPEKALFGPL